MVLILIIIMLIILRMCLLTLLAYDSNSFLFMARRAIPFPTSSLAPVRVVYVVKEVASFRGGSVNRWRDA